MPPNESTHASMAPNTANTSALNDRPASLAFSMMFLQSENARSIEQNAALGAAAARGLRAGGHVSRARSGDGVRSRPRRPLLAKGMTTPVRNDKAKGPDPCGIRASGIRDSRVLRAFKATRDLPLPDCAHRRS